MYLPNIRRYSIVSSSEQPLFNQDINLADLEILIPPAAASVAHALDEGDVVGLVEDEGAIWALRAVSGHHLWMIKRSVSVISRVLE